MVIDASLLSGWSPYFGQKSVGLMSSLWNYWK